MVYGNFHSVAYCRNLTQKDAKTRVLLAAIGSKSLSPNTAFGAFSHPFSNGWGGGAEIIHTGIN
jgi:hypothetical protein